MYWETVSPLLREVLEEMMNESLFDSFRLVGGTALSLQLGHRKSIDIDLFTAKNYGSIDFELIDKFLKRQFEFVTTNHTGPIGMGITYYIGHSANEEIKLDLYYTESFIRDTVKTYNIRMASVEDIIGMKLDIMGRTGRKKDFWDLHEIHENYSIDKMISLYKEKFPYSFSEDEIRKGLLNFSEADGEPDPICLLNKHWELIKLDFVKWLKT